MLALMTFWAFLLLLGKRLTILPNAEKYPAHSLRWWTGSLAAWLAVSFALGFANWVPEIQQNQYLQNLDFAFDMMVMPIIAMTFAKLTHAYPINRLMVVTNFLPFVMLLIISAIGGGIADNPDVIYYLALGYTIVYTALHIVVIFAAAQRHESMIYDQYASNQGHSLRWLWYLAMLMAMQFVLWMTYAYYRSEGIRITYYAFSLVSWNYLFCELYRMLSVAEQSLSYNKKQEEDDDLELLIKTSLLRDDEEEEPTPSLAAETNIRHQEFLMRLDEVCVRGEIYRTENLTRDMLARKMHIGHTTFTRLLRETTGKNFYEYINDLRISCACDLLSTTDINVADIGFEVGYRYQSSFYRAFAARHGCTPAEWRDRTSMRA